MNHKENTIIRYRQKLKQFGETPEALGWMKGRQKLRFDILLEGPRGMTFDSLLDFGCGFGDLYKYLSDEGWTGDYLGLDLVPDFVKVAQNKYGNERFLEGTIDELPADFSVDFTLASGVFNCLDGVEDKYEFIRRHLTAMAGVSRKCVAVNFLSDQVEFEQSGSFHANPEVILEIARELCPRYALRHDYMKFEFTIYLYLNQEAGDNHVYKE